MPTLKTKIYKIKKFEKLTADKRRAEYTNGKLTAHTMKSMECITAAAKSLALVVLTIRIAISNT